MPETIERTGYLLRLTPYSDSSSMALALGEEGYFSFAVRGLSSPKSPFRSFMFPLTKVRFLLAKGKGDKLSLKEGSPFSKPPFGKSLEEMAFLKGWITGEQLRRMASAMSGNQYGQYLLKIAEGGREKYLKKRI